MMSVQLTHTKFLLVLESGACLEHLIFALEISDLKPFV